MHCALVIEHLPIAGHAARSTPGVEQVALVIEQLPGTFAQGTCELHAALVLAQVPIDEQSDELRHVTLASFALAAIAAVGFLPASVWAWSTVIGAAASLTMLIVFFHPWLVVGVAIDVLALWTVLVIGWAPTDTPTT